jgi:hypothetical protein
MRRGSGTVVAKVSAPQPIQIEEPRRVLGNSEKEVRMANRVREFLGNSDETPRKRKGKKADPEASDAPVAEIDRKTTEYTQGKVAFEAGASEDDNPYIGATGGHRVSWFTGYFDARTNKNLASCFQRNGITFP